MSVLVGCNSRIFDPMLEAGINVRTFRAYRDKYNFIPKSWPSKDSVPEARVMLSIRPVPGDLLAGRLDDQLKALIATAPPGVKLSAWHEASNLKGYPGYIRQDATMSAVHEYMQGLCRGSGVRYGSIICAVPSQVRSWMGAGLDWYGLDVYDFGGGQFRNWWNGGISKTKLFARLDNMLGTCRQLSGRDAPEIDICETNSPRQRYRADWFTLLAEWMSANGGGCLETFWNPTGPLSGRWLPDDGSTISALRSIAAALAARLTIVSRAAGRRSACWRAGVSLRRVRARTGTGGLAGAATGRRAQAGYRFAGSGDGALPGGDRDGRARDLPRLRAGRRRGGDGRRRGRLVRGHGPVPPSAGAANTAYGADRRAQGSVRRHARPVCAGKFSDR